MNGSATTDAVTIPSWKRLLATRNERVGMKTIAGRAGVHGWSLSTKNPLIPVDCDTVPRALTGVATSHMTSARTTARLVPAVNVPAGPILTVRCGSRNDTGVRMMGLSCSISVNDSTPSAQATTAQSIVGGEV